MSKKVSKMGCKEAGFLHIENATHHPTVNRCHTATNNPKPSITTFHYYPNPSLNPYGSRKIPILGG